MTRQRFIVTIKRQESLICWLLLPLLCKKLVLGQQKYSHLIFKNTTFFTRAHPRHYIPLNNVNHFIYPFVQTIYERVSKLKYDNTIFEMKFGRAWQIPQPLPKQKRYRNSPSKFRGIVLKVLCNMKRSADFGFLHSSVCVNIKLQLQKSLKKTQNIIRFRKNNEQKTWTTIQLYPNF